MGRMIDLKQMGESSVNIQKKTALILIINEKIMNTDNSRIPKIHGDNLFVKLNPDINHML